MQTWFLASGVQKAAESEIVCSRRLAIGRHLDGGVGTKEREGVARRRIGGTGHWFE
jgi:hypothetical protein